MMKTEPRAITGRLCARSLMFRTVAKYRDQMSIPGSRERKASVLQ